MARCTKNLVTEAKKRLIKAVKIYKVGNIASEKTSDRSPNSPATLA